MNKREFKLVTSNGHVMGTYTGSTPRQAALKAASNGHSSILLKEHYGNAHYGNRVHAFRGAVRPLHASETSRFARAHGMHKKPVVQKVGTF